MQGLMQTQPLLISTIIEHAARHHADTEIVSRTIEGGADGGIHRYTYLDAARRAKKVAHALLRLSSRGPLRCGPAKDLNVCL